MEKSPSFPYFTLLGVFIFGLLLGREQGKRISAESAPGRAVSPVQVDAAQAPKPAGTNSDRPDAAPTQAPGIEATLDRSPGPLPALPPREQAFTLQFPDLLTRVRSGDPVAACRLILDLTRCTDWQRHHEFEQILGSSMSKQADQPIDGQLVDVLAKRTADDPEGAKCLGFDASKAGDMRDIGAAALARLSPRQKLLVAMTRYDGTLVRVPRSKDGPRPRLVLDARVIVPQFLADHDLPFIADGLAAHDPLALEAALMLHTPKLFPGLPFLLRQAQPNPFKFALYARLEQALFGPQYSGELVAAIQADSEANLTPAERLRLDQEVARQLPQWRAAQQAVVTEPLVLNNLAPAAHCE